MRISDWSSDVCSSDLGAGWGRPVFERRAPPEGHGRGGRRCRKGERPSSRGACGLLHRPLGELSGDARAGDRGRGGGMTRLLLKDAATCPWSGNPVAEDSLTRYRGHVVGFCNPGCRDKRSAESLVGKECGRTCRLRGEPKNKKN